MSAISSPQKVQAKRISINALPKERPYLAGMEGKADEAHEVKRWLERWIRQSLENKELKEGDILPATKELSNFFKVNERIMKIAIFLLQAEDLLLVRAPLGAIVCEPGGQLSKFKRIGSHFDCLRVLSEYIQEKMRVGDSLPSTAELIDELGFSQNNFWIAQRILYEKGFLQKIENANSRLGEGHWRIVKIPQIHVESKGSFGDKLHDAFLHDLQQLPAGTRLPLVKDLLKKYRTTEKTLFQVIDKLMKEGLLKTDSGRYFYQESEAESLEKVLLAEIKNMKAGEKLPAAKVTAKKLNVPRSKIVQVYKSLAKKKQITKTGVSTYRAGSKSVTLAETLVDKIKAFIHGRKKSEKLQSAVVLAKTFKVGEESVRSALKALQQNGLVTLSNEKVYYIGSCDDLPYERAKKYLYGFLAKSKAGAPVPPMSELIEIFKVSRNDARRLIEDLLKAKKIRQNKGSESARYYYKAGKK